MQVNGPADVALLDVRKLTAQVGRQVICSDFDLRIKAGERWALLGGNGVGKTTLLHTLAGLRKPVCGSILLDGAGLERYPRRRLARQVGVLLQDCRDVFPTTVMETALAGRYPYHSFWSADAVADHALAVAALAQLELPEMGQRQVDTLSGGERRRLAIATLFLQDPKLWLLDEPVNHLDLRHQIQALDLVIERVNARGGALLMALHDVNLVSRYCSHAILMTGEQHILSGPVSATINKQTLELLYRRPINEASVGERRYYFPA